MAIWHTVAELGSIVIATASLDVAIALGVYDEPPTTTLDGGVLNTSALSTQSPAGALGKYPPETAFSVHVFAVLTEPDPVVVSSQAVIMFDVKVFPLIRPPVGSPPAASI